MYGEDQEGIKNGHGIMPYENDLWIFPASLKHCVPPFKSAVERISVSGNFFISDKMPDEQRIGEFRIFD